MTGTQKSASWLPQLHGRCLVTDGGMETDLIFHHGVDLPHFAAFPLLEVADGRVLLEDCRVGGGGRRVVVRCLHPPSA